MFTFPMVMTDSGLAEAKALEHLRERLQERLPITPAQLDDAITAALARYADRPIRDFVPILVERDVLDGLEKHSP